MDWPKSLSLSGFRLFEAEFAGKFKLGLFGPLKSCWTGRTGVALGRVDSGLPEKLESRVFKR